MGNIYIPSLSRLSFTEESNFNEDPVPGAQTNVFGILPEEITLPDPEVELKVDYSVGAGANPHLITPGARTLSGSLPITLQNGWPLKYLLGDYSVTGSGTYTHSISCSDAKPDSFCLEARYNDGQTDFTRYYSGTYITGGEISAEEEGFVKLNADIESAFVTTSTTATPSSITQLETEPYVFCEGNATFFGSPYARVLDFNISVKRAFKSRRYIQSTHGCYPYETNFGPRTLEMSSTVVASQDTMTYGNDIYEELLSPSSGGSTMELLFTRGASDTMKITVSGCNVKTAPHIINPSAEDTPVAVDLVCKDINIEVVDAISTYGEGEY